MKIVKQSFYITLVSTLVIISCKNQERKIQSIDFKTDYKFNSEIEKELEQNENSWKHQVSASDYAAKSDYKKALAQWNLAVKTKEKNYSKYQIDSINQKYSIISAKDYIVENARKSQVVIINEAHHNSFHRVFTKSLLKKLYDEGYTNLGIEALSYKENLDSLHNIRKYPTKKSGYYIKDPQFANLIREALNIGYTIFPYETLNEKANGKQREIDQAKNIQKYIETKPNEKFLIHCGFDHVLEGNYQPWEKTMAGRLQEFTGINPLTIDQVLFSEKDNESLNHPLLKAVELRASSVLVDKNNNSLKYKRGEASTDISVFHPNTKYVDKRPEWLFQNGHKRVSINLNNLSIDFPVMVLAFKKGDNINSAIPIDLIEIAKKNEICNLSLKKSLYQIVVTNKQKSFTFNENVK